jgi:hypothetical protein
MHGQVKTAPTGADNGAARFFQQAASIKNIFSK